MNYIDDLARKIQEAVSAANIPQGDSTELFRIYAVLLLAKGTNVTTEDVHNAWVAWMLGSDGSHPSLVRFSRLPAEVSKMDQPYVKAIHLIAKKENL